MKIDRAKLQLARGVLSAKRWATEDGLLQNSLEYVVEHVIDPIMLDIAGSGQCIIEEERSVKGEK